MPSTAVLEYGFRHRNRRLNAVRSLEHIYTGGKIRRMISCGAEAAVREWGAFVIFLRIVNERFLMIGKASMKKS